jgi:Tfp pilus assembly protein PilW
MTRRRGLRGYSLVETLMAVSLTSIVLLTATSVFMYASYRWIQNSVSVKADADSSLAVQMIDRQLRQAMVITVDPNGNGVTYELPMQNPDGSYAVPLLWDGVTRRIALQGTTLVMSGSDGTSETLAFNVYPYDPLAPPNTAYQIFTAPAVTSFTSLNVMVVTGLGDNAQNLVTSRSRQTVYLRNIPQTTS